MFAFVSFCYKPPQNAFKFFHNCAKTTPELAAILFIQTYITSTNLPSRIITSFILADFQDACALLALSVFQPKLFVCHFYWIWIIIIIIIIIGLIILFLIILIFAFATLIVCCVLCCWCLSKMLMIFIRWTPCCKTSLTTAVLKSDSGRKGRKIYP